MKELARSLRAVAAALALLSLPPAAPAGELAWGGDGTAPAGPTTEARHSSLRLLAGWPTPEGGRVAGLRIELEPGWKTYWRVPGEAGIPPSFDWSGSRNLADLRVRWPSPHAFESYGMTTLGYGGEVILPLEITPQDPDRPVTLRLSLAFGVCSDICVPAHAELERELPPRGEGATAPIAAALETTPRPAAQAGARMESCALRRGPDGRRLEAVLRLAAAPQGGVHAVVEAPPPMWFEPARVQAEGARLTVAAALDSASDAGWAARDALRLTVIHDGGAIEFSGCQG